MARNSQNGCLQKNMGLCYRYKRRICAKEEKGVSIVERGEGRGAWVYRGAVEEGLHQTLEVVSDGTNVFCRKEGWEKEDGVRLPIP